jgi:hypothetical protein
MARYPKMEFNQDIADKLCELLVTSNVGIVKILKENNLPSWWTISKWLNENESFATQYARAREAQADFLAGEITEIADSSLIETKTKETKDGVFEETEDNVNRSRLMVDARKWQASKLAPKKYGDKLDISGSELVTSIRIIRDNGGINNASSTTS